MASTTTSSVTDEPAGQPPAPAVPADRPSTRTERSRPVLVHEPALDGLRGLAVAAVFAFHLGWIDGGFLGVDLFFALSGFLITSLLLVEHHRNGRIDLLRFWARRARRLFPALLLLLAGVALMMLLFVPAGWRPRYRGDGLATLGYVANWHRMFDSLTYWDIFNQPSPLDHTWSLAIEEQFYVLWPLAVIAVCWFALRRDTSHSFTAVRLVALAGGVSSLVLLALLYSPDDTNRAYFGTDARLGPILLGAALAAYTVGRPRRAGPLPWPAQLAGALAMAWLLWSLVTVDGQGGWYYQGGLALFTVAALVVIGTTTGGPAGRLGPLLAWRPLAALGLISYGVYLWHWPVIVYLTPERLESKLGDVMVTGWMTDLARIAVTLGIAVASYKLLELPIRHGALKGRWLFATAPAAVGVVLVAILLVTAGSVSTRTVGLDQRVAEGSGDPTHLYPVDIPPDSRRILLVGDSGVFYLGPLLFAEAEQSGQAVVATSSELRPGCALVTPEGTTRLSTGDIVENEPCHDRRREELQGLAAAFEPDVIVYFLANAGGLGHYRLDGAWVGECDAPYTEYFRDALSQDIVALRQGDPPDGDPTPVMVATSPYVGTLDVEASNQRVDCRNDSVRGLAGTLAGTEVVDMNSFVVQEVARDDTEMPDLYRDTVHFSDEGARRVAQWLLTELDTRLVRR